MSKPPLFSLAEPLLDRCEPSPTALLDWLRSRIEDDMLEEIARADYGWAANEHLAALRRIRDEGTVFTPMKIVPAGEVLSLVRWSEPDDPTRTNESHGARGHLLRLFCCAALARAGVEPMNQTHSNYGLQNTTIVQLLRSALALGPEAGTPSLRFLAWCALQEGTADEEYPFLALSIMLLATSLRHHEADGVWLWQLSDWVIGVEAVARSRTQFWRDTWDTRWLLGLGYDERSPLKEMGQPGKP
jgi:hypothetical protein